MLTEEGSEILQNGSHEVRLFNAVKGTPQEELMVEPLHVTHHPLLKCVLKMEGSFYASLMCVNSWLLGIGELLLHNFKHNRHHQA